MEPKVLKPFGPSGPTVILFGRPFDGSMNRLKGNHLSDLGLFHILDDLSKNNAHRFKEVLAPSPLEFNARICSVEDLGMHIQNGAGSLIVRRGCNADGAVVRRGMAFAVSTADCRTILYYCKLSGALIVAHAGVRSLVDAGCLLGGKDPRIHSSVVDAIVARSKTCGFYQPAAFSVCGARKIEQRDLASFLRSRYPSTEDPSTEVMEGNYLNLPLLISRQFGEYGIKVGHDWIDTIHDRNSDGDFAWSSHRRDRTKERNLIVVINH